MGKRQALAEYHRGSILAAAERLFSEKGRWIPDLAAAAGKTTGSGAAYISGKSR